MTSLVTAIGALPIALSLGAASQSRVPLGVVIVGGVLFSLVLTLYVIPAMYTYITNKKLRDLHAELDGTPAHEPFTAKELVTEENIVG
jgi:Cu/Ag efflux pump CusA